MVRGARARRGPRAPVCLAALLSAACSFHPSGGARDEGGGGDGGAADGTPGQPDADPTISCTAGERLCFGHRIETCNADGDGFVEAESVACSLTCEDGDGEPFCTGASNIPAEDAAACGGSAPALAPAGGSVKISVSAGVERITCADDCGSGQDEILRVAALDQGGDPDVAWFCLSRLSIPDGVTLTVDPGVTRSIAFLVAGDVTIEGSLVVDGLSATATAEGGAGPGGGAGGPLAAPATAGSPGQGRCPGAGGGRAGGVGSASGAGGSGAGYSGVGGGGGDGVSVGTGAPNDGTRVNGPAGGANTCDGDGELVPLVGGGGGGSGGDGSCGADCGHPGGGGGGALQISARGLFQVSGSLSAIGGAGYGDATGNRSRGGGGGGGAGGGLLLEAPALTLSGSFVVIGGVGGLAGAGLGGDGGGSGSRVGVVGGDSGSDADADGEGGAGGGGSAGVVRLNALAAPTCPAGVTPTTACTGGTLTVLPDVAALRPRGRPTSDR